MSTNFRLETAQSPADLLPHAKQWDTLALLQPQKIPFLTYGWTAGHIEYLLTQGASWACLFAYDGDRLVGVLPVEILKQRVSGMTVTVVRGLRHSHSYSYDFITIPDNAEPIRTFLLSSLSRVVPDWTLFQLNRIPEQSPTVQFAGQNNMSFPAITKIDGVGAYQPTVGSYEEYLKTLSSNFSSNLRRRKKKMDTLPDVRFEIVSHSENPQLLLEQFVQVESAGWKGKEKSAIGSSERLIAFYTHMVSHLHELGILEWHFLYQSDKAMAGHCATRIGDVVTVMKMGYDESFSDYAPGNIIIDQLNRRCFADESITAVNWLSDMNWHRNWQMPHWTYYNFTFYNPTALGRFLFLIESTKRRLAKVPILQRIKRILRPPKN